MFTAYIRTTEIISYTMADFCSSMFFKVLLMVIVTFTSAAKAEESFTVFTSKKYPVKEHFHTSKHMTGNRKMDEELQRNDKILDLVEKLRNVQQQEENSTFEGDRSEDFGSTSDFFVGNTVKTFSVSSRKLIDGPKFRCGPNKKRDKQGKCREKLFSLYRLLLAILM